MATKAGSIDNDLALYFKSLHISGHPLIIANTWDKASTKAVISLNETHQHLVNAIATTSSGIAKAFSVPDSELTCGQSLVALEQIAPLARSAGIPLTVDLQDIYGRFLERRMQRVIDAGAVGVNITDSDFRGSVKSLEKAADSIRLVLQYAKDAGLPDFVVNATTDVLRLTPGPAGMQSLVHEAQARGRAYLDAGATCVSFWDGTPTEVRRWDVKYLVHHLDGKVAVRLSSGKERLSTRVLAELGVCRISMGDKLYTNDMKSLQKKAVRVLKGGQLWSEGE